jgi:hypothetical protein
MTNEHYSQRQEACARTNETQVLVKSDDVYITLNMLDDDCFTSMGDQKSDRHETSQSRRRCKTRLETLFFQKTYDSGLIKSGGETHGLNNRLQQ